MLEVKFRFSKPQEAMIIGGASFLQKIITLSVYLGKPRKEFFSHLILYFSMGKPTMLPHSVQEPS